MSTPSPLNSMNPPKPGGASRMRFAVALIVSAHVIVIGGLLLQGCNPKTAKVDEAPPVATNVVDAPLFNPGTNAPAVTNALGLPAPTNAAPLPGFGAPAGHSNGVAAVPPPMPEPTPAPAEVPQPKEYSVVSGDSPAKIAKAHGVSLNALMAANPGLVPSKLKIGQKIAIPAPAAPSGGGSGVGNGVTSGSGAGAAPVATTAAPAGSHVVKAGETLTKIAKQHGVTVAQLRAANGMKTNRLLVGQKLKIPAGKPAAAAAAAPAQ